MSNSILVGEGQRSFRLSGDLDRASFDIVPVAISKQQRGRSARSQHS